MRTKIIWFWMFGLLAMTFTVLAQVTNVVVPPSSGVSLPTKLEMWDLAIGAVSPVVIYGLTKLVPKIPKPLLPTLTPLVGIGLGFLVNWLSNQSLSWFDAAKAGAMAVFFREMTNQWVTKRMTEPDAGTPPPVATPPSTPTAPPAPPTA